MVLVKLLQEEINWKSTEWSYWKFTAKDAMNSCISSGFIEVFFYLLFVCSMVNFGPLLRRQPCKHNFNHCIFFQLWTAGHWMKAFGIGWAPKSSWAPSRIWTNNLENALREQLTILMSKCRICFLKHKWSYWMDYLQSCGEIFFHWYYRVVGL